MSETLHETSIMFRNLKFTFKLRHFLRIFPTCEKEVVLLCKWMNLGKLCCNVSYEIFYNLLNTDQLVTLNFHYLLLINFNKSMNKDHENKNILIFAFVFCCNAWKIILASASSWLHSNKIFKCFTFSLLTSIGNWLFDCTKSST